MPGRRAAKAVPNNLPLQLTTFIGRSREKSEVTRLLGSTRLLTLTGAGGAGKTRLALQVASEGMDQFRDGVWFVELAPLFDPALVPLAAAAALGVAEQPARPIAATLLTALRDRRLLLILDNCEHVIAACAELAEALLRACPGVQLLTTSREALGISGETAWRVPSLSLPDPGPVPPVDRLREYEAIQLFEARAQATDSGFQVTAENAAAVVQVCRRLDGIPLALELAAARLNVLTVEQLAGRLDDRFRLLTGGSRTALPRHQTLRAAMEWSYELLSEEEQQLLRRLAVFAGGWTLEAAEAVCSKGGTEAPDVLDLLTRLVAKSLVAVEPQRREARYRLLETVRQYARDRLVESVEAADVRRRHRDWYLALADRRTDEPWGPRRRAWLERLDDEHDNMRVALELCAADPGGAEAELRIAGGIWSFWHYRGHYAEGRRWLEGALARREEAPPEARAEALHGAAVLAWRQGDYDRAEQFGEMLLSLGREQSDTRSTANALTSLGLVAMRRDGDFGRATAIFEEALPLAREHRDRFRTGLLLAQIGLAARYQGDYDRAAALLDEGLAEWKAGSLDLGWLLRLQGHVSLERGDLERAEALYAESLHRRAGMQSYVVVECLEGLAGVAAGRGQHERAGRLWGAADAERDTLGSPRPAWEQTHYERHLAAIRAGLGKATFGNALAEGRAMPVEESIEYALSGTSTAGAAGEAAKDSGPLTTREREVAALVAKGLTNREIASRLVISERTADSHVQHILNKLGFSSRAQIAAWATERGLQAGLMV